MNDGARICAGIADATALAGQRGLALFHGEGAEMKGFRFAMAMAMAVAGLAMSPVSAAERAVANGEFVRTALEEGVQCLLARTPGAVSVFLQRDPDSKDAARQAAVFNRGDCVQSATRAMTLEYAPALYRGAFYKQMYIRDFSAPQAVATASPVDFRAVVAGTSDGQNDRAVMRQFAACVVQADPATARAMVLAPAGSQPELSAFAALQPRAGLCSIQGRSPEVSLAMLSGAIAEILYRSAPVSGASR